MFRIRQLPNTIGPLSSFWPRMHRQFTLDASIPDYHGLPLLGVFDRRVFRKSCEVLAVQIPAIKTTSILRAPEMRGSLLNLPRVRNVEGDPSDPQNGRLVLLRVTEKADLSPEVLSFLEKEEGILTTHTVTLNYDYWSADEIIKSVLPQHLRAEAPSGFATVGHIAHLNLNQEYLPFKRLIGQIILDKNRSLRTVVNKLDAIDSQFRFFKMELIAGEPDYVVEHHESDCAFTFDFRQVYWNSRLHSEHGRLVDLFQPEDVVADVFAGVGPFAIPAARKGCAVLANDLNPNSVKYLDINIEHNGVGGRVRSSCEDGRNFILSAFRRTFETPFPGFSPPITKQQHERQKKLLSPEPILGPPRRRIAHFVMNLPDTAINFLDAFRGVLALDLSGELGEIYSTMPMIHCHCFTRELQPENAQVDIIQRVEEKLEAKITTDISVQMVRSVAPGKEMYCISFRLPREVALSGSANV